VNILILTRRGDEAATDPVLRALSERGAIPWRVLTDDLPHEGRITWRGPGEAWLHLPGQGRLDLSTVHSIWRRRTPIGANLPGHLPADVRAAARGETTHVLLSALLDTGAFWVDSPAVYQRARNKALQLHIAQAVGLRVPRTLETNDPEEARAFLQAIDGPVIAKMFTDVRLDGGTVFTNTLRPGDEAALESLSTCPMILQERIPKAQELRVVVCGDRVFAAALPTGTLQGAQEDWRRVGAQTMAEWRPFTLHYRHRRQILALHQQLHTNYGAADLILTPDDELVFLENNAVGESFWFYDMHPLAEAWADLLTAPLPARRPPSSLV